MKAVSGAHALLQGCTIMKRQLIISIIIIIDRLILFNDILWSRADSLRSCRMWFWMSNGILLLRVFLISTEVVYW